ncbi:MAG: hypothetical protein PHN45_09500 [Methylococcales bacterium]|nr:hypothetical protein [Methylococcales bacterium]
MTLTKNQHTAILCPPQHEVGRENPFSKGDNSPQSKAVFLCLSFFNLVEFDLIKLNIMMVLFGQSLGLVATFARHSHPTQHRRQYREKYA